MSGKYLAARDAFGAGEMSWTNDRIRAQLLSASYRFDESHRGFTDIEADSLIGRAIEVQEKAILDGWLRCAPLKFEQVIGESVVAVVFIRENDGRLIEYHDAIEKFPMQTNGGDIEVEILEPGIFRI